MRGSPKLNSTLITAVILECGHSLKFDRNYLPNPDDVVFCYRCDDYRKVPLLKEWKLSCDVCRYRRMFGADIDAALIAQAKHAHHVTTLSQVTRLRSI
jgi:hypothetical protein